jgi:HD-GYP domain-containing protein (c-di-GMP phosphodiesterase class II)
MNSSNIEHNFGDDTAACESTQHGSRDTQLIELLSQHMATSVRLCETSEIENDAFLQGAVSQPQTPHSELRRLGSASIAVCLPEGSVATWDVDVDHVTASCLHCRTILELEATQYDKSHVDSEVEALATQVCNDFEELSLIRTLAAAMALPNGTGAYEDLVSRSLPPLVNGIGAVSMATVFLEESGDGLRKPIWAGEQVLSDEQTHQLVRNHTKEAAIQSVVRNELRNSPGDLFDGVLNEFIMIQCRSENRLHGWLVACNRVADANQDVPWGQHGFTTVQASLMETATNQLASQLHNVRLLRQKEELFTDVIRALVNAVEARDPYTCGHSERVASFARCLALISNQPVGAHERVYLTGLLHDIGKIAIPDGVLQKPGKLNSEERAIIETHTDAGWRILHELDALRDVLPGVLYHHEHYDGNGYPDGLIGENIPIDGRILAVCDAFDAMTSDRPYRNGMPVEKALSILREGRGKFWDPVLIDAFANNIDQIEQIRISHKPRQPASRPAPIDGVPIFDSTHSIV